ncbi:MAG: hypothetical protein Q7J23_09615 [Nitrosomonas sp.]|nr:hypothetical protein [Nitrosomonas sp.]
MKFFLVVFLLTPSFLALANESIITDAQEAIKSQLKDPYSAVFDDIYLGKAENGAPVVCGTVNAKNSYGGYTGRKKFYYLDAAPRPILSIEGESSIFSVIYESFCLRN